MIGDALEFILNDINQYLDNKPLAQPNIEFTNFVGEEGCDITEGKVGFGLINISEETTAKNLPHRIKQPNGQVKKINPEMRLNLHVLFAARRPKAGYKEGLTDLSNVIAFFQGKKVFDRQNSPGLPQGISQLVFDMHSIALEDQSYLWGALTTNYLPSVIYKVRLVTIFDDVQLGASPQISQTQQIIR